MYTNLDYARGRLSSSIVRDNEGEPLYVIDVASRRRGLYAICEYLKGGNVEIDLSNLNLEPVPLGYVNNGTVSTYATRIPQRAWKQGLRGANTHYTNTQNFRRTDNRSLRDTILNNYPTVEECIDDVVNQQCYSRAFCRNFAIKEEKEVWYKDIVCIGSWSSKTKEVKIDDQFFWTREEFMKGVGNEEYAA